MINATTTASNNVFHCTITPDHTNMLHLKRILWEWILYMDGGEEPDAFEVIKAVTWWEGYVKRNANAHGK